MTRHTNYSYDYNTIVSGVVKDKREFSKVLYFARARERFIINLYLFRRPELVHDPVLPRDNRPIDE